MHDIPRTTRQMLLDYALGQLPAKAAQGVEEQLPENSHWGRFIDRARSIIGPLDRWPAPPVPADLVSRTLRAVREADRRRAHTLAPSRPKRHLTFTLLEAVAVAASVALVAFLLLPSLQNAHIQSLNKGCATNLHKIGEAMAVACEREGNQPPQFQVVGTDPYWNKIGAQRGRKYDRPDSLAANTRALWHLVRMRLVTTKSFVCPRTDDKADPTPRDEIDDNYDFTDGHAVSYSYQIWFGTMGRPRRRNVAAGPILADRSPLFEPDGKQTLRDHDANSRNHDGRGQYALLSDLGTVKWLNSPQLADTGDNIWTPRGHPAGRPLEGKELPASDNDVFLGP